MTSNIDGTIRDSIGESIHNHPVGFEDGTVLCSDCGARKKVVEETGPETFFARVENNPRTGQVTVGAVYCENCKQTVISTPTRGIHEARVEVTVEPNPVSTPVIGELIAVHDYSSSRTGSP